MSCNNEVAKLANPAISQAFAHARDSLAAARASNTGSWWNASVLRKRETLINALSEAVQSGTQHVDIKDFLDGTGGHDTQEERADNEERNANAISSIRPLIEVLVGAGMAISGVDDHAMSLDECDDAALCEPKPFQNRKV